MGSATPVKPTARTRGQWIFVSKSLCRKAGLTAGIFFLLFSILFNTNVSTVERVIPMISSFSYAGSSIPCRCDKTQNASTTTITTSVTKKYALFYHVYINPESVASSDKIINEQLTQWQNSQLAKSSLYYGLVGNSSYQFPCPTKASCKQLFNQSDGWEINTLQKLFEFCQRNPSYGVVYLHNKGSYHENNKNHRLRRILTRSACSDECRLGLDSGMCDVCSARFSLLPRWHVTGNIWVSTCRHVVRLIAPNEFELAVKGIVNIYSDKVRNGNLPPLHWVGLNRFAAEHWLHTFPSIRPCDVVTDGNLTWGYPLLDENTKLELQAAPRWPLNHFKNGLDPSNIFFRAKYRLSEFQHLYKELPPNEHFFWRQYLEGDMV